MRSHLKLYFDFDQKTEKLEDAEKGRLLLAMLRYAKDGTEPDNLYGNEQYLFPIFKMMIDEDIIAYDAKVSNGSKGGRPVKAEEPKETEENLTKPKITEIHKKEERRKKREEKENTLTGVRENLFERFWFAYPRHEGKQNAQKAFEKLNVDDELLTKILTAIDRQKQSTQWKENGGQYIPHPATWLNGRRWEDETQTYTDTRPIRAVNAQQYSQRDYNDEDAEAYARMLRNAVEEDALP